MGYQLLTSLGQKLTANKERQQQQQQNTKKAWPMPDVKAEGAVVPASVVCCGQQTEADILESSLVIRGSNTSSPDGRKINQS